MLHYGVTFSTSGVIDPLGGIWTLWPLFGTANQMLAAIALTVCTVVLFKMKRERFAVGDDCARDMAGRLHGHCGSGKSVQSRSKCRLCQPCIQIRRCDSGGPIVGACKDFERDEGGSCSTTISMLSLAAVFVLVVIATVIYGLISIRKALGNPQPTDNGNRACRNRNVEGVMPDLQELFDRSVTVIELPAIGAHALRV